MKKDQPLILAVDTATPATSVALTRGDRKDGHIVASLNLSSAVTHSRRLLTSIDYLMTEVGVGWNDIAGIGVSLGPGSFTGLRIGMATVKGLAAAAGKPLLAVSTLDTLAGRCVTSKPVYAVLDARKKEVYAAPYRYNGERGMVRTGEIRAYAPVDLAREIVEPALMVGDGAVVYRKFFTDTLGDKVVFAPAELNEPSAACLGMICCEELEGGNSLEIGAVVPLYVRSSDAELNLKKRQEALAAQERKIQSRQ